jgi:hypothetical protein
MLCLSSNSVESLSKLCNVDRHGHLKIEREPYKPDLRAQVMFHTILAAIPMFHASLSSMEPLPALYNVDGHQ